MMLPQQADGRQDLNSTNGTYINGEKISEAPMKPGQILRLGQIEMRLETDAPPPGPKTLDQTLVMQRGVNLSELETGARGPGFGTKGFAKKDNKANKIVIGICILLGVVIALLLFYVFAIAKPTPR